MEQKQITAAYAEAVKAIKVNSEMLRFYWSVGKDIEERQFDNKYGSHFYENLSRDLSLAQNKKKGFSPTSLKYTKYFYCLYSPFFEIRRQPADELRSVNRPQAMDELSFPNTNCLSNHSLKICRTNFLQRAKLKTG